MKKLGGNANVGPLNVHGDITSHIWWYLLPAHPECVVVRAVGQLCVCEKAFDDYVAFKSIAFFEFYESISVK